MFVLSFYSSFHISFIFSLSSTFLQKWQKSFVCTKRLGMRGMVRLFFSFLFVRLNVSAPYGRRHTITLFFLFSFFYIHFRSSLLSLSSTNGMKSSLIFKLLQPYPDKYIKLFSSSVLERSSSPFLFFPHLPLLIPPGFRPISSFQFCSVFFIVVSSFFLFVLRKGKDKTVFYAQCIIKTSHCYKDKDEKDGFFIFKRGKCNGLM